MPFPAPQTQHFPPVQSHDLNGRAVSLPHDIPADRTLILIGFQREQQANIDTWTRGLGLRPDNSSATGPLPWLEIPVVDKPNALLRMVITTGMRRGIPNHAVWAHIITLYTNKAAFNSAAGITSEAQPIALVMDRAGNILQRETGDYTPEAADRLRAALRLQ